MLGDLVSGKKAAAPDANQLAWELLGLQIRAADDVLVVSRVRSGSAAERIGIERGDVLLGLDGEALDSLDTLGRRLEDVRGNEGVVLSVGRGRRRYDIQLPLPGAG